MYLRLNGFYSLAFLFGVHLGSPTLDETLHSGLAGALLEVLGRGEGLGSRV